MSVDVPREGHYVISDGKVFPICLPCKQDPSVPDIRDWLASTGCLCIGCTEYRLRPADDGVLESRVPVLNSWADVAVLALHSHAADEPCGESCSVYGQHADADTP